MNLSELVPLYFERSNALQSLWTLYVVIIGGLLAFSSLRQRPDLLTTVLVGALFLVFAFRNLGGIRDVTAQRLAVREAIRQAEAAAPSPQGITATLTPPTYAEGRNFHLVTDLLVVLTLGAIELRRRRHARNDEFSGYHRGT